MKKTMSALFSQQLHFELALSFFKDEKNRVDLSYTVNCKLVALWKQHARGKLDVTKEPPLGWFDFVGRDRRRAWRELGDMTQNDAMTAFSDLLRNEHPGYSKWLDQRLKEKEEKDRREREQEERERQVREQFERERQERVRRQEEERARLERERLDREHEEERQRIMAARQSAAEKRPAPPVPTVVPETAPAPQSTAIVVTFTPEALKTNAINRGSVLEIARGEVVRVKVPNPGGSGSRRITWHFMTEARDIGFGVDYETAAVTKQSGSIPSVTGVDESTADVNTTSIQPIVRVGYNQVISSGSHTMSEAGCWLLLFDNSFSYMRAKKVYYHVEYTETESAK